MTEQTSEVVGSIPNTSASFGNIPHDAEVFRNIRNEAERTEHHTLTVREVARMFEASGVPRTERSIINWCQKNRQGVGRLDAFYDMNERKYFITTESTTRAIQEEQAKAGTGNIGSAMPEKEVPNTSAKSTHHSGASVEDKDLELKMRDLEITNRVKDQAIAMHEKDRERLMDEREGYVRQLMDKSHRIGQLETRLLQLGAPASETGRSILHASENREENADGGFENRS